MSQKIVCPNCKTEIDLDKIGEEKYKNMLEKQEKELKAEMNEKAIKWAEEKAKKLLEEKSKKDSIEMEDLKTRLKEQEKASDEMKKNELEMRKKARELEDKEKNFELEMARKMDEEKRKLEEQMSKIQKQAIDEKIEKIQEENRKKELEWIKREEQMKKSVDDWRRKAEQGSQQIQGDIQEDDLKNAIMQAFPIDSVDDVATWVKWADLIQTVKNNVWQPAWIIVWESKNTKSWQDAWVMKLKDDKLKINWNIAILVSTVMPKDMKNFGMIDDVMVCVPEFAIAVATMLRDKLISISKVETSMQWKDIKMEMLYKYLSSEEFSSKISMMVDVFAQLKIWIDSERRAMEKNWKKREKDLERATFAVTWMYWELESLMWQALPGSERLELGYGEEEDLED
jgi:hypothetical protein